MQCVKWQAQLFDLLPVVIHDPEAGHFQESFDFLAKLLLDKVKLNPAQPQVCIMEGERNSHENDQINFPPAMAQTKLPGPYGHCGGFFDIAEIHNCDFGAARAFPLHDSALQALARGFSDPWRLSETLFPHRQEMVPSCAPSLN